MNSSRFLAIVLSLLLAGLVLDLPTKTFIKNATAVSKNVALAGELQVYGVSAPGLATEFDNDHYDIMSHSAWASLIPANHGFVLLDTQNIEVQVAMYQQLDCINNIRIATLHLYRVKTSEPALLPAFKNTDHCFGILRHLLLCAADTTLESPEPSKHLANGSIEMGLITGLGASHRCMDWDKVWTVVNSFPYREL